MGVELRPGHEVGYYPGETNLRSADIVVINKVGDASPETLAGIRERIHANNITAELIDADLEIFVDQPEAISGKRVLVVEDGPTLTHGEMSFGAGTLAARRFGAREIIDPSPFAVGSFAEVPVVPDNHPRRSSSGMNDRDAESANSCSGRVSVKRRVYSPGQTKERGMRILIADGDKTFLELVWRYLLRHGYDAKAASDEGECADILCDFVPDVEVIVNTVDVLAPSQAKRSGGAAM